MTESVWLDVLLFEKIPQDLEIGTPPESVPGVHIAEEGVLADDPAGFFSAGLPYTLLYGTADGQVLRWNQTLGAWQAHAIEVGDVPSWDVLIPEDNNAVLGWPNGLTNVPAQHIDVSNGLHIYGSTLGLTKFAAYGVIGRAANSVGYPDQIEAAADGDVLRVAGGVLGFGHIPSTSVTGGGGGGTGLTFVRVSANATATVGDDSLIDTAGVALGSPSTRADGDRWDVTIASASVTGCTLPGDGTDTVEGQATLTLDTVPISLSLIFDAANTNWFVKSLKTGLIA